MRSRVEWSLRVVALALLAWTWWRIVYPTPNAARAEVVDATHLAGALARWTTADGPGDVHVRFDAVPGATVRDWLTALVRAGSRLTWDASSSALPATAVDAEPVADPRGVVRVAVSAPAAARVVLSDRLGAIDSIGVPHGIASFRLPPVTNLAATVGGTVARATVADSLILRRIYLVGRAGWEAKFVARALEEEGWGVDAHFVVAPSNDVATVKAVALDTAHYAAVVLVDTALAVEAGRIAQFVKSGGGLVLGPGAARAMNAVGEFDMGRVGEDVRGSATISDSAPELGLALEPVVSLAPGASVLARRGGLAAVTARRAGDGRVVRVGYMDTWRWRMAAGDRGAADARAWWAGIVAVTAYAPRVPRNGTDGAAAATDPAPLVAMRERLGGPQPAPAFAASRHSSLPLPWIFGAIGLALLVEWASRRSRGAA